MPFKPGHARCGGRKKKVSQDRLNFIETVNQILDGYGASKMLEDLQKLEPEQRLKMVVGLAEYAWPKMARVENSQTLNVNVIKEAFLVNGEPFYLDGLAPPPNETKIIDIE